MKAFVYTVHLNVIIMIAETREEADRMVCDKYGKEDYREALVWADWDLGSVKVEEKELVRGELHSHFE